MTTTTTWPNNTAFDRPLSPERVTGEQDFTWRPKAATGSSEQLVVTEANRRVLRRWLRSRFAGILLHRSHR
ncbi:hypothetical protein [Salinibacterium sp. ZJ454]|uniref:hypothetical protein n=1 Tax=Salinibacterium sp. ZJ454 TaxID=2708339 RepID=UPI001421F842|nr:hypothetical protein [Salinibacterium sp. ZJ454]